MKTPHKPTKNLLVLIKRYYDELNDGSNRLHRFSCVLSYLQREAKKEESIKIDNLSRLVSLPKEISFIEFLNEEGISLQEFVPEIDESITLGEVLTDNEYEDLLSGKQQTNWDLDKVFFPISEWHEDLGSCLFFKLDAGEPPVVTSPLSCSWDSSYFTHFMELPIELRLTKEYVKTCISSGIKTNETTYDD